MSKPGSEFARRRLQKRYRISGYRDVGAGTYDSGVGACCYGDDCTWICVQTSGAASAPEIYSMTIDEAVGLQEMRNGIIGKLIKIGLDYSEFEVRLRARRIDVAVG